jgi:hypothetical protein
MIVREPGLANTPGWVGLSQYKKDWLQEKTSNIKKFASMEGLASVSGGLELLDVERGLQGETMTMTSYMQTVFGSSERTGWRKLALTKELSREWPAPFIKAVAERGALLLRGAAGIGLKDLVNVSKELPAPKDTSDKKVIDGFIETKVRVALKEHKSARRTGKVVKVSDEDAAKILFNIGLRIMRTAKNLDTSENNRQFLKRIVGWWMEGRGISGTLECERISIPEGTFAKVGRPRKKSKEKPE